MKKISLFSIILSLLNSLIFAGTVTDRDGNKYKTVRIGKLEWMAEDSKFETAGSQCVDEYADLDNCVRVYGQGISDENMCPKGWRLPTTNDITDIENSFFPANYEQMTEKQRRHALPEIEQAFNTFLDSKKWPVTNFSKAQYNIYHIIDFSSFTGNPLLRSFFRPSKEEFNSVFFVIDGVAIAKVRCVNDTPNQPEKRDYQSIDCNDPNLKPVEQKKCRLRKKNNNQQ